MSSLYNEAIIGAAGQSSGYEIEQSLRFDGSSYLSLGTGTTHTTTNYTISLWFKMNKPNSGAGGVTIFDTQGNNNTETAIKIAYDWNAIGVDKLGSYWHQTNTGNNYDGGITSAVYRDPSAWYHVVAAVDTTQSTAVDRVKYFVNGVQQAATVGSNPIPQNYSPVFRNFAHRIGETAEWYLAEYHFTSDGTKTATDFGEYDNNGVWRPIEYTGSYGTFGFYLKFDPTATNGIGHDHSGNGLHWTANSFTTSGTGTDVMSDTPTANWCTLNGAVQNTSNGKATLSEGNLVCSVPRLCAIDSTFGVTSGKYYWEVKPTDLANSPYGPGIFATGYGITHGDNQYLILTSTGALYTPGDSNNQSAGWGPTYNGSTDVIGLALDMDNHTLGFNKNGGSFTTYDFSAYITSYKMANSTPCWKSGGNLGTSGATFNFGQRAFEYTAPTGYKALNTSNLPAPTIKDGSDYFDTTLYTGNSAARTISMNSTFTPDFIWIKGRSGAYNHSLQDVVRGFASGKALGSNLQSAESAISPQAGYVDGVGAGTFDLNADATATWYHVNVSGQTYVAWNWLAGNGTSSNTDGSITSTVSSNPSAGFSVVSYTGQNAVRTIGHGLGVAPKLIIVKNRDITSHWFVYHGSLGATKGLSLNLATKQETNSGYWNNTEPTSTVFTVGTHSGTGGSTNNYIAYCFAEVDGYSRVSTYSANGSADGPAVFCGFRPSVLIIKNYAGGSETNWVIKDTTRDTYNPSTKRLNPNQSYVESDDSNVDIDFLANGFKIRSTNTSVNENGSDYIFIALAENPFGGSDVTPATAR